MSVGLTFFGALLGAAGILVGFYALVLGILSLRSKTARPRFGVSSTGSAGQLAYWFNWDPSVYAIEVYRFVVNVITPHETEKEHRFTVTMDPPGKKPFWQPVDLPAWFTDLLSDGGIGGRKAMVTVSIRTVDELCLQKTWYLGKFRKLMKSKPTKPAGLAALEARGSDEPSVSSLDYSELTARKDKLSKLIAAAKAKEKKAPPPPAAPKKDAPAAAQDKQVKAAPVEKPAAQ